MNRPKPALSPPAEAAIPADPPPNSAPTLLDQIRRAQKRHVFFPRRAEGRKTPVVVGVSGGADSVCLLHLLAQLADEWALDVHVAHVDHGLRPRAQDDAHFVADLAANLALPWHMKQVESGHLAALGGSLEAAARRLRRAFLVEIAASLAVGAAGAREPATEAPAPTVALAHTADDQAETVLMHFLRGSGPDGLAGMRPVTQWPLASAPDTPIHQYARIVRPLLDVERAQVIRYLSEQGLTWREDETNWDTTFTRNRLRHHILPQLREINPNLNATLGRTASLLADESARLRRQERTLLAELVQSTPGPMRTVLDLDGLQALDPATQRGVLRMALTDLLAANRDSGGIDPADQIEFAHVDRLVHALAQRAGATGPHPISAGLAWTVAEGPPRLSLHRADCLPVAPDHPFLGHGWPESRLAIPGVLVVDGWQLSARVCPRARLPQDWSTLSPWAAFVDGDALGAARLAVPRPGQRFAPLGMDGDHKNLGDFFTDRKIPAALRPGWPLLLAEDGRVAWVCGLHPAHDFQVTSATERIVHLSWGLGVGE